MTKYGVAALIMLGMFCLAWIAFSAQNRTSEANPQGIVLLNCDRSGAVLEVSLPEIKVGSVTVDQRRYSTVAIRGWGQTDLEGKPALPQGGVLLAIPPGATVSISTDIIQTHSIPLESPCPVPTTEPDLSGTKISSHFLPDAKVYGSAAVFPAKWAQSGEIAKLRDFQVVPIRINPIRYDAAAKQALVADRMRIRITFSGGRDGVLSSDPFGEDMARHAIINYQQARTWQDRSGGPAPQTAQSYGQYKVLVPQDGLYVITYDDLLAAGITPASIDPSTITLSTKRELGAVDTLVQVPLWIEGESDGQFDPEDYVLFFGSRPRGAYTYYNLYTATNVYWLDWGANQGLRLDSVNVTPGSAVLAAKYKAGVHAELDTMYYGFGFAPLTDNIDHWMWYLLDQNYGPASQLEVLFALPQRQVPPTGSAYDHYDLAAQFRGYTYNEDSTMNDHAVSVYWQDLGKPLTPAPVTFADQNALLISTQVPASYLTSPTNPYQVIIRAENTPADLNAFYLDWIRIDYWRNYHVENDTLLFTKPQNLAQGQIRYQLSGVQDSVIELWDLTAMTRLVGFSRSLDLLNFQHFSTDTTQYYIAGRDAWMTPQLIPEEASSWKNADQHVDYFMITHEDFYDALQPLVDHYGPSGRNMTVARVKISDIYDEFNFGLKDPQAIFDFLQYAYFNYNPPAPQFVLLVGDASWDYKNQDDLPYQDFVPTHHYMSSRWGETAADNFFVAVSGNDPIPDLSLGRFPANTPTAADTLVMKTLSYADAPPGLWRQQLIMTNGAYGDTTDAPYFDSTAQALLDNHFPAWYDSVVPRVYYRPAPGNEQYQGDATDLISYFNIGAAYVNYIGHAGNQMWETLTQDSIHLLDNGARLPLVGSYSCFTGIFSNTTGFGETMVAEPDGGAVAYWSNAGIGYTFSNYYLNDLLFQQLFDERVPTIGAAIMDAKVAYAAQHGGAEGVLNPFTLLGDPASLFIFDSLTVADSAAFYDDSPPTLSVLLTGGPNGANIENGSYADNPIHAHCVIYDSTRVDPYSFRLELEHASGSGSPQTIIYDWPMILDSMQVFDTLSVGEDPLTEADSFFVDFSEALPGGNWTLTVRITDYSLNGQASVAKSFIIAEDNLAFMTKPLNYPNPFVKETSFTFELTRQAEVTIKVFTVSGKLIRTIRVPDATAGYNIIAWDGRDEEGDPLSNGAYLYKVIAHAGDQQIETIEKLVKMR